MFTDNIVKKCNAILHRLRGTVSHSSEHELLKLIDFRITKFPFVSSDDVDKICRRQLKEGHHADVLASPVDSMCSQITQIGQPNNQVSELCLFSVSVIWWCTWMWHVIMNDQHLDTVWQNNVYLQVLVKSNADQWSPLDILRLSFCFILYKIVHGTACRPALPSWYDAKRLIQEHFSPLRIHLRVNLVYIKSFYQQDNE